MIAHTIARLLCEEIQLVRERPAITEIMWQPGPAGGEMVDEWYDDGRLRRWRAVAAAAVRQIIAAIAAAGDHVVTPASPILEVQLPPDPCLGPMAGARVEAMIPPVVPAPTMAIRIHGRQAMDMADLVARGTIPADAAERIIRAIRDHRRNILVAGATGSGKTTLARAILASVAATGDRIVVIEDTPELAAGVRDGHMVYMCTSDTVDQTRLLRAAMRLRPDRIVVGEVRDSAAYAMIRAWGTGHPGGIATIHAGSCAEAMTRLGHLVAEAGVAPVPEVMADVVHVVVVVGRDGGVRKVKEIRELEGWTESEGYCWGPSWV